MKGELANRFLQDSNVLQTGFSLKPKTASQLEVQLMKDQSRTNLRLKLVGFYAYNRRDKESILPHLIWMIEHIPDGPIWRDIFISARGLANNVVITCRDHWLKQIETNEQNANIAGNAGFWLASCEPKLSEQLLSKATELSRDDWFWYDELSKLYFTHKDELGISTRDAISRSLANGRRFLDLYDSEYDPLRADCLERCAYCALKIGELDVAVDLAMSQVDLTSNWTIKPKAGLSILGLVHVQRGEMIEAQQYLLNLCDSSRINSWDLELANELLQLGQLAVVQEYLQNCKTLDLLPTRKIETLLEAASQGKAIDTSI